MAGPGTPAGWQPLIRAADLAEGELQRCHAAIAPPGGDRPTAAPVSTSPEPHQAVLLCRVNGMVYALDDTCPHEAISLSLGSLQGHQLRCPLHGSAFDVRDGRVLSEPCESDLRCHTVELRDGWIGLRRDPDQSRY